MLRRRSILAGIAGNAVVGRICCAADRFADFPVSPEDYGAVGDGVADDYPAWLVMADAASTGGPKTIACRPNRTYLLNRYVDGVGSTVRDIIWRNANGLSINLNGSTVRVRGGFNRNNIAIRTLEPFRIFNCNGFRLFGGVIDGANATIIKRSGVTEAEAHGIEIGSCLGGSLHDLEIRNFISDGVVIGNSDFTPRNPLLASRNISLEKVNSHHNGRQALTLSQVYGFSASNCNFDDTGQSSYGWHAPGNGLDVEPDRFTTTAAPFQMDINTGNIRFDNCAFNNNVGQCVGTTYGQYVNDIVFSGCSMDVGAGNVPSDYGVLISSSGVVIDSCKINVRDRTLFFGFNDSNFTGRFSHNTIYGSGTLFRCLVNAPMLAQYNDFFSTKEQPDAAQVIYLSNTKGAFLNNTISIPAAGYQSDGGGGRSLRTILNKLALCANNSYATDLRAFPSDGGTAHFASAYDGAGLAFNENYAGTARGPSDSFRPGVNSRFDTSNPFSLNAAGDVNARADAILASIEYPR